MTLWRLFPTTNGPAAATAYSGNFIGGFNFEVTQGGCWLEGYYLWVCSSGGQNTGPTKCCLYSGNNNGGGSDVVASQVVTGSVVTSGTLSAGWNFIPLATPIPLAIGMTYIAAIGINGPFPDTQSEFGTAGPYINGITSGPLTAYSDLATSGGTNPNPWGYPQMMFNASGTADPTTTFPGASYGHSDSGWMDVQISDTAPSGYSGSYRLWPNTAITDPHGQTDSAVDYAIGTEIDLSQACQINAIWFYSPKGALSLPTKVDIWQVLTSGLAGTNVYSAVPVWSGAFASGWIKSPVSGLTLPAASYRVAVYNANGSGGTWSEKLLGYWGTGSATTGYNLTAPNGIRNGPLYAPNTANAKLCFSYQPPSGTPTEPGQSPFAIGPPDAYPNLYVGANSTAGDLFQNYFVDMEVTPVAQSGGSVMILAKEDDVD